MNIIYDKILKDASYLKDYRKIREFIENKFIEIRKNNPDEELILFLTENGFMSGTIVKSKNIDVFDIRYTTKPIEICDKVYFIEDIDKMICLKYRDECVREKEDFVDVKLKIRLTKDLFLKDCSTISKGTEGILFEEQYSVRYGEYTHDNYYFLKDNYRIKIFQNEFEIINKE